MDKQRQPLPACASPGHPASNYIRHRSPSLVYKGSTPDAPRVHTYKTLVHLLCIRCAPLVHKAKQWGNAWDGEVLELRVGLGGYCVGHLMAVSVPSKAVR